QAFILGWAADYPDPQDFLDVLLHSDSDLNNTRFSDPEVDRLLEAARVEPDEQRRMELYREAERIALEGAPWIPLFAPAETWVVAPYVHGFELPAIVRPRMADVWLAIDDEP
ncbi:MAG: ABC transporter substrate-binding protein, partial [Anaerolineae bacterium]